VARNKTVFEYADGGVACLTKFHFETDPRLYVWFGRDGEGSLFTTKTSGPYRAGEDLAPAPQEDLDALLAEHGTNREEWVQDLMAQFGERLHWACP